MDITTWYQYLNSVIPFTQENTTFGIIAWYHYLYPVITFNPENTKWTLQVLLALNWIIWIHPTSAKKHCTYEVTPQVQKLNLLGNIISYNICPLEYEKAVHLWGYPTSAKVKLIG